MFLYSLLEVSEQTTDVVKWISVGGVVVLFGLILLIGFFSKKTWDTKQLAFAGVCVATSFILAFVKIKPVASGGSVTLASFAPVMLYAFIYGPQSGFIVGLIHGLLNFIESPYILTPATFLFDYLLAFMAIGVMGFFGKLARKERGIAPIVLGTISVYALRFLFHFFSGVIFFMENAIWVEFPSWAVSNAFVYSFIYQCVYIPADAVVTAIALIILGKAGVVDTLVKRLRPKSSKPSETFAQEND
ncbi:MAG: energy-coupled thiamine transporter ThiT [Clostridia bacterium]|nr:energy-coupled thiamine transporter ThiT [Clostridia bacterium]